MNLQRIETWEDLVLLREEWNNLVDENNPVMRWDWLATWWKHYGEDSPSQKLFVIAAYDSAGQEDEQPKLIGIAPWLIRTSSTQGDLIELLGEEEVCTDHHSLIVAPNDLGRFTQEVARYLTKEFNDWDVLNFYGIDDNEPTYAALLEALAENGLKTPWKLHAFNSWQIELPETWEAMEKIFSKSHRSGMRRLFNRLNRENELVTRTLTSSDDFDYAWPLFVDLHQRRWTSLGEPGCFASEKYTAFQKELIKYFFDSGNLEIEFVYIDGKPICVDYNVVSRTSVFSYQGGIDPDELKFQPGNLAIATGLKRAIDAGKTTYDFLRGDERYKPHWRAKPFVAWHYRISNRRATSRLRNTTWTTVKDTKELIKSGIQQIKSIASKNKGAKK